MVEFSKPGPEHQALRRLCGAWTARIRYYPSPGAQPEESNGEFLAKMDLGGYFLCRDVNYGMQGYQGRAFTGYDPLRKAYVGTWADSTSPVIYMLEGRFDEKGRFCEIFEGPDASGALIRARMTTEILDPNQMIFTMHHLLEDGTEPLMLEIEHSRRRFV